MYLGLTSVHEQPVPSAQVQSGIGFEAIHQLNESAGYLSDQYHQSNRNLLAS